MHRPGPFLDPLVGIFDHHNGPVDQHAHGQDQAEHHDIGHRHTHQGEEGKPGYRANLDLLFSIVYYIRVFPDKYHHPKEEDFLFKALRERDPESAGFLDQVTQQHSVGDRLVDELDAALKAYQDNYPDGLDTLAAAAETFVSSQFEHMQLEEEKILPAAEAALTPEDWTAIDQAFTSNKDPMFGENLEVAFHSLHDHIVRTTGLAT